MRATIVESADTIDISFIDFLAQFLVILKQWSVMCASLYLMLETCSITSLLEASVIKLNGRRLIIHPSFQLVFIFSSPSPKIPYELASTTTIVDLRPNANGVLRFFLLRSLKRLRPDLDVEDNKVYFELFQCYDTLEKLDQTVMALIRGKEGSGIWDETDVITTLVKKRTQVSFASTFVFSSMQTVEIFSLNLMLGSDRRCIGVQF